MYLKYLGKTPNFEYKGFDFSEGPAEVPDELGKKFLAESPQSFLQVVPVVPAVSVEVSAATTADAEEDATTEKVVVTEKVTPIKKVPKK